MDFDYFDEIQLTFTINDKKKLAESIEIINEIKKSKFVFFKEMFDLLILHVNNFNSFIFSFFDSIFLINWAYG